MGTAEVPAAETNRMGSAASECIGISSLDSRRLAHDTRCIARLRARARLLSPRIYAAAETLVAHYSQCVGPRADDDTDTERNSDEFVTDIVDTLGWLGIDWDEAGR